MVTPDLDGERVAIIEPGTFGGTCLNAGCIPTKMYVFAADVAKTVSHAAHHGVERHPRRRSLVGNPRTRFGRIGPVAARGQDNRVDDGIPVLLVDESRSLAD